MEWPTAGRQVRPRWPDLHEPALVDDARTVIAWHLIADRAENRALADTDDGTTPPPLLLGDRMRAVLAGGFRDGDPPRWQTGVAITRRDISWAQDALRAGLWQPGPQDHQVAAQLLPTLRAEPDTPDDLPPATIGPAWIQRVTRLTHIHRTVHALSAHQRETATGDELDELRVIQPFGAAVTGVWVQLDDITQAAAELDALWAARGGNAVSAWERQHLPVPVRAHITALESLVTEMAGLCIAINTDPDDT